MRGISDPRPITFAITETKPGELSLTLTTSGRSVTTTHIMRENDHIYFNTMEPQGRFIGTLNDSLLEGTWHEGILIWKMELKKTPTP